MRYLLTGLTGAVGLIAVFLAFVHQRQGDSSPATTARATGTLRVGLLDPADADYFLVESDSSSADYGKFIVGATTVGLAWGDGVLAPGTSEPYDWPDSSGAKFSRLNTREQSESRLQYLDNQLRVSGDPRNAQDDPAFHSNIPASSDILAVPKCRDAGASGAMPLSKQIADIILSKTSRPYASVCPLHEVSP